MNQNKPALRVPNLRRAEMAGYAGLIAFVLCGCHPAANSQQAGSPPPAKAAKVPSRSGPSPQTVTPARPPSTPRAAQTVEGQARPALRDLVAAARATEFDL